MRVVYSPLDAVRAGRAEPDREVVFFAVGFETTAPANAMAAFEARRRGLAELLAARLARPRAARDGGHPLVAELPGATAFSRPGTSARSWAWRSTDRWSTSYRVPIVVTGFEPLDILQGIAMCVRQLEEGRAEVENQYERSVQAEGNQQAQEMIREVFEVIPRAWRGIGTIPESGLGLRAAYAALDAERKFQVERVGGRESPECKSGLVLQGLLKPPDCPAFGKRCTPESPLGATMVSSEGACAAYYRYRRFEKPCPPSISP